MNNMINKTNFMHNNNVSVANTTTVATADVDVPTSTVTNDPTTGLTVLENPLHIDNNVVATITNEGVKSTTCSVASVASAATSVLTDAQVVAIFMSDAANAIDTNTTVSYLHLEYCS